MPTSRAALHFPEPFDAYTLHCEFRNSSIDGSSPDSRLRRPIRAIACAMQSLSIARMLRVHCPFTCGCSASSHCPDRRNASDPPIHERRSAPLLRVQRSSPLISKSLATWRDYRPEPRVI